MATTYLLALRCPVCRRRDSHSGSHMERENLLGDAKGKGTSGNNCEAESTNASGRGGPSRSVCWVARESGGLKSLQRSDEGRCIQRQG
jgi:hypothetical protein